MKLIIQIPCYNEAQSLPVTLKQLPRKVDGFEKVEWLVINDGSSDNTADVAKENTVDHILNFSRHQGLARAFSAGLDYAVKLGADVIVNLDADNQYNAGDIPALVKPILEGKADLVVGTRPIDTIEHFSTTKKILQKIGSWAVSVTSNTVIPDAASGFRAISRDAAMKLNVFGEYTYTLETLIQAGYKRLSVQSIPIRVNDQLRPSRLVSSLSSYVAKSAVTILRIFITYQPFKFFIFIGILLSAAGLGISARFLYLYFAGSGQGHVQSLILAAILLGAGLQFTLVAFLADLMAVNRKLLEDTQYKLRKLENNRKANE